jgi:hypothetical protein
MFGRNFEDFIKVTEEPRSFDEDFFDFTDKLYPWTTVYRFFFLADLKRKTQFMLGVGQKNIDRYNVNGKNVEFSNNNPLYKVGVSYWLDNGKLLHETSNEEINVQDGMISNSFTFQRGNGGYNFELGNICKDIFLDDKNSRTDYVRFQRGISPFYRHNKYLSFTGKIKGEEVSKGLGFIQKVNLNMPFLPWRWGRVFFEGGGQLDFYEPRIIRPLYRSINFEVDDLKLEFKRDQKIVFRDSLWSLSGTADSGEKLEGQIHSYQYVPQIFETPWTTFNYIEMPSHLKDFQITREGEVLYSKESLGDSVANCEESYYSKILI